MKSLRLTQRRKSLSSFVIPHSLIDIRYLIFPKRTGRGSQQRMEVTDIDSVYLPNIHEYPPPSCSKSYARDSCIAATAVHSDGRPVNNTCR